MGFVSAFSRLPVHPANTKANNRAMILIRAIPFCQVSKQGRHREGNAIIGIGGWKYDPREIGKPKYQPRFDWSNNTASCGGHASSAGGSAVIRWMTTILLRNRRGCGGPRTTDY
jgi:hypothetical protein